jgi:hypothetical protein
LKIASELALGGRKQKVFWLNGTHHRQVYCDVHLFGEKKNITAKESMQALLDAGRHNDVEENAKIAKIVFNHMSFSHH